MKYLAIHHTAVKRTTSPQLYGVNRYHRTKWGMKSSLGWYVGYNYFIDVDGTVTQTRAHLEETVANKGHNCDVPSRCDTISICLADNYQISWEIYPEQEEALHELVLKLKRIYPDVKVVGHRDIQEGRTCPGQHFDEYEIAQLNNLLEDNPDQEKADKIMELQSRLDALRALLQKLLNLL